MYKTLGPIIHVSYEASIVHVKIGRFIFYVIIGAFNSYKEGFREILERVFSPFICQYAMA